MLLQIRRPNNYDFSWAERLGPTDPNPTIDLSDLDMVKTIVQDSPNKLFIGGLPCEWPEDQVSIMCCVEVPLHSLNSLCLLGLPCDCIEDHIRFVYLL